MTAVSKVTLNGTTLMDATTATASANEIISPYTAMTADGVMTTGTASGGGDELLWKFIEGKIEDDDIDWSKVTKLRNGEFYKQKSLTTVPNPIVEQMSDSAFYGCSGLKTLEITGTSSLQGYGDYMFADCTNLETATIHFAHSSTGKVAFSGLRFFRSCTKLHTVILDNIGNNNGVNFSAQWFFSDANAMRTMVLKSPTMVNLTSGINEYAWGGIYKNPTESTIYVPQALISDYQTASNWSALYNAGVTFAPIEGSIYDD